MRRPRHATSERSITTGRRGLRGGVRGVAALLLVVLLVAQAGLALRGRAAQAAETQDGDSVYLTVGDLIWYGGLGSVMTARMSVNDEVAYCSDPANDTPKAGYYAREPVKTYEHEGTQWSVASVERILFHGYGGPGFDKDLWLEHIGGTDAEGRSFPRGKDWDGSSITGDDFHVYTHVLLADRVSANSDDALIYTSDDFKAWFCWNILGYTYGHERSVENPNAVGVMIDELSVPDGFEIYQLDTGNNSLWHEGERSQTVMTFEYNPLVVVRFDKVSADATLTSSNEEYALSGATYDIYEADTDAKVATIVTDESGRASCELEPNTSYYAVETKAPQGFVTSEKRVEFVTDDGDATVRLPDEPGTLRLTVRKVDSATLGEAQVGVTLEGAEYKVVDASGKTHRATTDENGTVAFAGLPFGSVSVTEVKAPEGYVTDGSTHEYHVGSEDMPASGVIELVPEGDFVEDVVAFDLDLVKYRDTGAEGSGLQDPAAGVEFQIISGSTNEVVGSITTDESGYATTAGNWFGTGERPDGVAGALPYDREGYVVREVASTTPEGYQPAPDWHVTPDQMADGVTLHYIVDNDFVATRIQVVKTDAETGQRVPMAGFAFQLLDEKGNALSQDVWYPNHEQVSEFVTDETGCVTFPGELAPGTYLIREIAAEPPYLLSGEDLAITIESSAELAPLSVVRFSDEQATGAATITKVCSDAAHEDGSGVHDVGCEGTLSGAEFDVVAMQDVTSPDGTISALAGEVVAHVVTGEDGVASVSGLSLGSGSVTYAFVETKPAAGHALDATPHEFTLAYVDASTPEVYATVEAVNEPTTVTLDKTILGTEEPLPGTTFAVWREGDDGAEGDAVTLTTDDQGTITLRHLLPGTYRIAETDAPGGYVPDGEIRSFTVDEDGLVEGAPSLTVAVENDFTKVLLSKRDITTEEEVPGAHLSVLDDEGNVVEQWVSDEEPHLIEALPAGVYTLVEEMTPHTYDEATRVEFSVSPTGDVQTVIMYDEPIEVAGQIDKRQEVADLEARDFSYSVDARSLSTTWVDEFTVTDELTSVADGLAELTGITTPVAGEDYDGLLNVWYQTNLTEADHVDGSDANATLSDGHDNPWLFSEDNAERLGDDGRALSYEGWRLWAQDVSAVKATELAVDDLDLESGEMITAIRLEYGRVEKGFSTRSDGWGRDDLKDVHDNVDEVSPTHEDDMLEEGVERAPLVVRMRLTDAYTEGETLTNQARVDLFRNGGGAEELEGHDDDRVEQAPEGEETPEDELARTGEVAPPVAGVTALGVASVLLSMRRGRRG